MASACVNSMGPHLTTSSTWGGSPLVSFHLSQPQAFEEDSGSRISGAGRLRIPPRRRRYNATRRPTLLNGKLLPLHLSITPLPPEKNTSCRRSVDMSPNDQYLFSPKVPRCSTRWRQLLGLKKNPKLSSPSSSSGSSSIRHFLHKNPKMPDSSLSLPLLKDSSLKSDSVSSLSRLSLSSSSSGYDNDIPWFSLEKKPGVRQVKRNRMKRVKQQEGEREMMDSPRMNPSGKIIYKGLDRSSSSPSSLNDGPRYKHRVGIQRSYSANVVRVTNVPVCSLRGSSNSGGVFGFGLHTGVKYNHYYHHRPKESS